MDHFDSQNGKLYCEQIPLSVLAEEVGTPVYVYSASTMRDHVKGLQKAFAGLDPLICFAVKANPNLAVLGLLREAGCGFDIVSGGELARAQAVGADPSKIVFSGVGKTEAEMEACIRAGVLMFNVESEQELEVLAAVAAHVGRPTGIAIRVNPDVDPQTHRYITTGRKENKFGVDLERGADLARRALTLKHIVLRGIQCHIGSQITDVAPYRAAVERTCRLALELRSEAPDLAWLNMGGGYGIYYKDEAAPDLTDYADAVRPVVEGTGLRLMMEPGRVIVGNAGVLLTRVAFNKTSGAKRFVIVDAGMNDLLRPSLYEGYHRIWPVLGAAPPPLGQESDDERCDIVGPVCESGDFLAKDRPLPAVDRGDVLAVMSVGAYGASMGSNYNARRRPPEVLVDGARHALVRVRETYEDMLRLERPDAPYVRASAALDADATKGDTP